MMWDLGTLHRLNDEAVENARKMRALAAAWNSSSSAEPTGPEFTLAEIKRLMAVRPTPYLDEPDLAVYNAPWRRLLRP